MNNFLYKMERKFGKYAIGNLTLYIIALYVTGYIIGFLPNANNIRAAITLNPYAILHGEIWRLVSWVLIPPSQPSIFLLITLYLYYFVGTTMERTMGTFRYNVFIFTGMLLMILSAFLSYAWICSVWAGDEVLIMKASASFATYFSTSYIQQIVFLAFAICYPNVQFLLMFIIPVKVKYLGIVYAAILVLEAVYYGLFVGALPVIIVIVFQFINLGLFYISIGKAHHLRPSETHRRKQYQQQVKMAPKGITRHKCAVCGRTESDDPMIEFRFCSKCNGNYEYCQDHLFTHQHIR